MPMLDENGNPVSGSGGSSSNNTSSSDSGALQIKQQFINRSFSTITPQYIVIHNTAGGTASSNATFFINGAGGSNNCTQFITDDKEIIQVMKCNQKAQHIQGSNTAGGKGCSSWASTNAPALSQCGATNSNSIGIEVADGYNPNTGQYDSSKVDMSKAVELTIELTRYLMKEYNIPAENVVRHGDTHNKPCPNRIMELGLWPYFKEQIVKRNQENKPVSFNVSTLDTSQQPVSLGGGATATLMSTGGIFSGAGGTPLYASPTDIEVQLPDIDHRENTTNMDEVKGVTIVYYPPYNACETEEMLDHFKELNWDSNYHFVIGKPGNISITPDNSTPENPDDPEGGEVVPPENEEGSETEPAMTFAMPRSSYVAFVGDSLTVGIGQTVSNAKTYATTGQTVSQGYNSWASKIVADKPLIIVMSYGTNDAAAANESKFVSEYTKFINYLKENIPNVQIFINKILPGDPSKPNCTSGYKTAISNIPAFNNRLSEIASATGATLIDATAGISSHYSNDGLHLTGAGYQLWYDNIIQQVNNSDSSSNNSGTNSTTTTTPSIPEGDPVGGDKELEGVEGFKITAQIPEIQQTKGFADNDTHTYIDRALFKCKREKHNLTVALQCPKDTEDYPTYEKALIEGLSIILHEHALTVKDLWREFDLNRAPSPFLYLDRDIWKDLLTEVEKQLNWRIAKYGEYTKEFYKYTAGSSGLSGGTTGSINGGGGSIGGFITTGTSSGGTLSSGDSVADTVFKTLSGLGLCDEAACGVLGNIYQESGMNPTAVNSSSGATGLCQWLGGRLTGLKNYASSKGTSWSDVTTQAEWAWMECEGKDPTTKSLLDKNCGGPEGFKKLGLEKAVDVWRRCFERCGENEANDAKRLKMAREYLSKVQSNTLGGGGNENTGGDNGGGDGGGTMPPLEEASLEDEFVTFSIRPRDNIIPDTGGGGESNPEDSFTSPQIYGWPLPGISSVSSKFGPRTPPCPGATSFHGGIDIGAASGTPIKAYAGGKVVQNQFDKSAGNFIKIDHGNGVASRYLHMCEKSPLAVGSVVTAGQDIGKVGNTGVGTGAHLHFEIHINGEKVDPLQYVNPGGGTKDNPSINPGAAGGTTGGTIGGTVGGDSNGLLYDDQKQQNTNAPISGNSAGGVNHDDWGGKTIYKKGTPTDEAAEQPEIMNIVTQEMFEDIIQYSDFALVDDYVLDFEPYGKGLASIDDNQITPDDRISAMTKQFTTKNENTFHYKVIESGPGSKDHCVTIAEELNYLAIPQDLTVEPIYPDLVIPPGYISTDADESNPNGIPIATIKEGGVTSSDSYTKQLSFDYDLLKEKQKVSNKTHHPINYTDPYPYDEKITDLERHYPKVFIDEIEGQLYSCNHPGCPISQPMAKNFAMLSDAMLNQSKRIEKRLARVENILSTIIRNQGRLGARMNINCVYYGGHSTFNKYKCIRCLHDDRVHDGQLVTIDQCLNCTRFEPILGQVYRILDDSGLNGSIILDDMQMSYTNLEGFKNLNDITHRSSKYFDSMATEEKNCIKPLNTLEEIWKEADKNRAIEQIREECADETEAQTRIDELKEEDYIFKMDWAETFLRSQEPDTKLYPNEGIVARQKAVVEGDGPYSLEDEIAELDPEMDKDVIEELKEKIKIRDNIWVDTRNTADAVQLNKYSSENFFFEDFNKVRIGKYGIKFSSSYNYNGEDYNNIYGGAGSGGAGFSTLSGTNSSSAFASQARNKIVEMAKQILSDCEAGKAWYSQQYRTVEYTKPVTIQSGNGSGKTGYDCTSFVSCCYMNAGLNSMYAKSCGQGSLIREIQKGGKMIPCTKENMTYILEGDILITASGTVTQNDCNQLKFFDSSHAAIYVGNNQIIHARGKDKGIQASTMDYYLDKGNYVFVRPADLIESDKVAAQQAQNSGGGLGGGLIEESGTISGQNYVAKIPGAVVTAYTDLGAGASGMGCAYNSTCASHNLPYGTKIFVPGLVGQAGQGIYTITDTGGPLFDFDICTSSWAGKTNMDVYVLEWGTGKVAGSYTYFIEYYLERNTWSTYVNAWNTYKNMGGKLIGCTKFSQDDANITSHPHYND